MFRHHSRKHEFLTLRLILQQIGPAYSLETRNQFTMFKCIFLRYTVFFQVIPKRRVADPSFSGCFGLITTGQFEQALIIGFQQLITTHIQEIVIWLAIFLVSPVDQSAECIKEVLILVALGKEVMGIIERFFSKRLVDIEQISVAFIIEPEEGAEGHQAVKRFLKSFDLFQNCDVQLFVRSGFQVEFMVRDILEYG